MSTTTQGSSNRPTSPIHADQLALAACRATTDVVFVKDAGGVFLYVNPAGAALFGAPASEIVGTNDERWLGPAAAVRLRAEDLRVLESRIPSTRDEELDVGGSRRVFSTTKSALTESGSSGSRVR